MFRGVVARLCRKQFAPAEVGEAAGGADGLQLCRDLQPDVVLLDLDLPDANGLDLLDQIPHVAKKVRIIVLSSHVDDYSLYRCLKVQVDGFDDKNYEPVEVITDAIRTVMTGRKFFSAAVGRARAMLREDPMAFTKLLSDREQELLTLFGRGLTNEEVAERTGLSVNTAHNHRRNIMGKLNIHSAPELIRYAVAKGFTRLRTGV